MILTTELCTDLKLTMPKITIQNMPKHRKNFFVAKNGFFYKPCKLYHFNKNIRKAWKIIFYQYSVKDGKTIRRSYSAFNGIKDPKQRMSAAQTVMLSINTYLADGYVYQPFDKGFKKNEEYRLDKKPLTVLDGFDYLIEAKNKDVAPDTIKRYMIVKKEVAEYLQSVKGSIYYLLNQFTKNDLYEFASFIKEKNSLSDKSYNLKIGLVASMFNFLEKKDLLEKSNTKNIEKKRILDSRAFKPFTEQESRKILLHFESLGLNQLSLFCRFMYYTFCRPNEELRLLKIKDIGDSTIFIDGNNDKNSKNDYITIPEGLQIQIQEKAIRLYNKEYYVFGSEGVPGPMHRGQDYFTRLHNENIRAMGFGSEYSLYGWKHTGNVAMYNHCKDVVAIQRQNRHSEINTTMRYLRGLRLFENEAAKNIPII